MSGMIEVRRRFEDLVADGVAGSTIVPWRVVGSRLGFNNASWTDVTGVANALPLQLPATAGETVAIVSTSNADRSPDVGAHTVVLVWIDGTRAIRTTTITMNGNVEVLLANVARANFMYIATGGSGIATTAQGAIRVQTPGGATIYLEIPQAQTSSTSAQWSNPSNETLRILGMGVSCSITDSGDDVAASQFELELAAQSHAGAALADPPGIFVGQGARFSLGTSGLYHRFDVPIVIPPSRTVKARARRAAGAGLAVICATIDGYRIGTAA